MLVPVPPSARVVGVVVAVVAVFVDGVVAFLRGVSMLVCFMLQCMLLGGEVTSVVVGSPSTTSNMWCMALLVIPASSLLPGFPVC